MPAVFVHGGPDTHRGWDVAELWTDADRLFAVFGLVAAEPAQGS
jgi:hypothetical protein